MRVAALAFGPADALQWGLGEKAVDFFDIKGDLEALLAPRRPVFQAAEHPAMHPGRCAAVWLDGQVIGHVGDLHPRWRQAYELPQAPVLFELDLAAVQHRVVPHSQPVARQQAVLRDLALVVADGVSHDALVAEIARDEQRLVRQVTLFDIYRPATPTADIPAGHRSLALRLELLDDDATLTDDRIDAVVQAAVDRVQNAFAARLRG
jgi:phenylalanyl-tRNA synthetase beta chain